MSKDIKLRKIGNIVNYDYISKIGNIVEDIKDVIIEVRVDKYKTFEFKNNILTIINLEDGKDTICALLIGNRSDQYFKEIVSNVRIDNHYRIRGNVSFINEEIDEELEVIFSKGVNIKDYIIGDKLLFIKDIQNIDKDYINYEKVKLFDVDITTVYDFSLETSFDFVNKNTNYLKNITIDEVSEIKFSYYKDIIILLKNGKLLFNGEEVLENIKTLGFIVGMYVFAFSNDNVITCLTGSWDTVKFINNNNYKYKKIINDCLGIVALTNENTIKFFGTLVDGVFDYNKFSNVLDIGYNECENDIVIFKKDGVFSLFNCGDYTNKSDDILLSGCGEDFIILD